MKKIIATIITSVFVLTSCGVNDTKPIVLEGIKDESAMGAITSKAEAALDAIYTYSTNQATLGIPLEKLTLDMLNQNLRTSSVISGSDAPKYYGGLPNVASVVPGKTLIASASGTDDICLYIKITQGARGLDSVRGVARDSFCRAAEPITTISWAEPNSKVWPDGTITKLPTLAEYQAYDLRHPNENVIPTGYTDKARSAGNNNKK